MLEIIDLGYQVKTKNILKGINLRANPGEVIGITGRSGSGKSTLLKIIAGQAKGFSGNLLVNSKPISKYGKQELKKLLTIYNETDRKHLIDDTLYNSLIISRKAEKKFLNPYSEMDIQITEKYMRQLNLDVYRDRKILTLPGGVFKKMEIAFALIKDSGILLLDNPEAKMDIHSVLLLQKSLQKYVIDGDRIVIIATNDLNFISQTADRIYVLDTGSVAVEGKPEIITADLVKNHFDTDVLISRNIYNGKPNLHLTMEI